MTQRGKTSVIPWPDITIGNQDVVTMNERFGQGLANSWGASRRAFLSSCIKDRAWMDEEVEGDVFDTFHGDIQQSNTRMV